MPRNRRAGFHTNSEQRRVIIIVIVGIVAFGLGFIVARAKYKSQLAQTVVMVQQKDAELTSLNKKMDQIQNILKMSPSR